MDARQLMLDGKMIALLSDNEADHLLKFAENMPARVLSCSVSMHRPPVRVPFREPGTPDPRGIIGVVVQDFTTVTLELEFASKPRLVVVPK